jgi:hypothetical protein
MNHKIIFDGEYKDIPGMTFIGRIFTSEGIQGNLELGWKYGLHLRNPGRNTQDKNTTSKGFYMCDSDFINSEYTFYEDTKLIKKQNPKNIVPFNNLIAILDFELSIPSLFEDRKHKKHDWADLYLEDKFLNEIKKN